MNLRIARFREVETQPSLDRLTGHFEQPGTIEKLFLER
jgi:hypothetical protein